METEVNTSTNSETPAKDIISSWGITFGDMENRMDNMKFLHDLGKMKEMSGVTEEDLLKSLGHLLKGSSRLWYRIERHRWKKWNDFVTDFKTAK